MENLRPVSSDKRILETITMASENIGKMVASLQSEMIESQARQDVQNEQKVYTKVSIDAPKVQNTNVHVQMR